MSQTGYGQTAGTLIVKGRITYSNGVGVSNWAVNIRSDSSITPAGCIFSHTRYTNANGYYSDTISCTLPLYVVLVTTKDCNNNYITHIDSVPPIVPPLIVIEDNFTICTPGTVSCHAAFTTIVNNNVGLFNSTGSTGSSASAIVERRWSFGDGSTLSGNIINPAHTYVSPGTYSVKLVIITTNNQCRDSVTHIVVVVQTPSCQAYFIDSVIGKTVYSNSSYSTTGTGDSIIQRQWTFGDNTGTLSGNVVAPSHTYASNGTYYICLKITSARGCVDSFCKTVTISSTLNNCVANFVTTHNGSIYTFNSSVSQAPPPNIIVRRKWEFGNGDTLGGNIIAVTRTYTLPGSYNIKLTIYTQNGCISTYTQVVNVYDTSCHANFIYNTTPASSLFTFSSTSSGAGSPITSYYWNFGDSTHATTINPTHVYPHPGTYNVCLTIATANGCQSTKCYPIVVQGANTSCHASIQLLTSNSTAGIPVYLDSRNSTATQPDTIYQRLWSFGDGSGLSGNVSLPSHVYFIAGTFTVRLIIVSTSGCRDTAYSIVAVAPNTHICHAAFSDSALNNLAYFFSGNSYTSIQDSIIERRWTFGDGTAMTGNVVNPIHQYAHNGTYTVCLRIISSSGCRDSVCKSVVVGNTIPICTSYFTYTNTSQNTVQFNSTSSYTSPGDSIIQRYWNFGDNIALGANIPNPLHTYSASGIYNVCLTIITARGCQNTFCKSITIVLPPHCTAIYKYVKLNQKTLQFNSGSSATDPNDSIVQRKWTFGDGSTMTGNIVSPVKTYAFSGLYNVCLRIQTAKGCVSEACIAIRVGDSTVNVDTSKKVEILSIYPNPATTQFTSLIWSRFSGVTAELAIIDIYGIKKWTSRKLFSAGNNFYIIPTNFLLTGPYTFRVTTLFGIRSKRFYKL